MNNKGFTLVETVLSFALVTILLVSLVAITVNYREKVENEQINTMMTEFKTTITKLVYDDIIESDYAKLNDSSSTKNFISITACSDDAKCAKLNRADGTSAELRVINNKFYPRSTICNGTYGIYLDYYNGKHNCIFLPDSERNCFVRDKKPNDIGNPNCDEKKCYDCDDLDNLGTHNSDGSLKFSKEVYSSRIEDFYISSNPIGEYNVYNLKINFANKMSGYEDYISITINK